MGQKTHQAVAIQLTAVKQRRNNKSYQDKTLESAKITIPIGTSQSGRIDCRHIANQLVVVKKSVDITKHTLLSSAYEHEQRDSANKTIVIVTDKLVSAINCPIEDGIVPLSWLLLRYLLISQSTHCCYQDTNTNRETAR